MLQPLRDWARAIKRDAMVLWLAARDARTSWRAKVLAGLVGAYALSPIDLIPDFIPVLGYLDDLVIVPVGIWLALKLLPAELLEELRAGAQAITERPVDRRAEAVIGAVWLATAGVVAALLWSQFRTR